MTNNTSIARLTLERLARTPAGWIKDANCLNSGVDMMTVTETQMEKLCGSCVVREQCEESGLEGTPISAGARGGDWKSRRTPQQP